MSEESKFARVIGAKDVIALAFGAMIGWGWVVLAGGWINDAGSVGALLAFVAGGIAIIMIGLVYAELASAMPQAGGEHVYSYRALGEVASFFCTWAIILGYVSVVAFEAVALPTVIEELWPGYKVGLLYTFAGWDVYFTWVLVGIAGAIAMTWINIRGIEASSLLQKVVTALILLVGILFFTGGLASGDNANLTPLFENGVGGFFAVLVMVPFLFVGFDVIPQAAEEINLPYRKIGILLIASVLMAVVWYVLVVLSTGRALNAEELGSAKLAVPAAATALFGGAWAGKLIVIAGIGGIITSWNAFLIGGSRAVFAMAEARMLPPFLAYLHPRYKTPVNAILLVGALSIIAPLFGRKALVWLVDSGGLGIIVAYFFVAWSFVVLRRKEPEMPRPFRAGRTPVIGYISIVLSFGIALLYLPFSPAALVWPHEWVIVIVWVVLGLAMYAYSRLRYGRSSLSHG